MEIAPATPAIAYFESADRDAMRLLAHPAGEPLEEILTEDRWEDGSAARDSRLRKVSLAVGPEGGFADEEVSRGAAAGWRPVSLGPRILRVETAALALAARFATT
jgi:16S rRNA (uracil1498-N3)-methyltransferase